MNIVNRLTLRNMQQNKRRTLVTIIGVIISVAMVTAVTTLGVSFMDLLQRQAIARDGEWHVLYKDVSQEQLQAIKNDEETKTLVISRDLGYTLLEGNQNRHKPYLFIKEYDSRGFENFPIDLIKGRLPQANNEVVISEEIAPSAKVNLQIGDQLVLDIGERVVTKGDGKPLTQQTPLQSGDGEITETLSITTARSYTVVGIIDRPVWEPAWAPGYTVISYVDESFLGENDTVNASVVLNKVRRSLYTHAQELAQQNNIATVEFNNELLRFYGVTDIDSLHKTLYSLIAIIMAIIVVGSVALIYNAFAISVSERSRHLGMLSSVGATRKQKRDSVFFEGAVIALVSIPLGVLCGLGGLAVTFWFINPMIKGVLGASGGAAQAFTVSVTPLSILGACVISMLTIYISTYWPAKRASNISAIDAIRQTTDIKLNNKAVKTSKLVRRLFGFEAEIGLKSLKRNKRRYQATVFSLVISIILFLTVSYFTDGMRKSAELSQDGINFDIQVMLPGESAVEDQQLIRTITGLHDVTEYSIVKELTANSWIDDELIPQELREKHESLIRNGKYPYYINIHALDEESLQDYAKAVGVDYDQLRNTEKLCGIAIETISYQDYDAKKFVETKAINAENGQELELYYTDPETQKETNLGQLQIAALTDKIPMGVFTAGPGGLSVIVSEQVMAELVGDVKIDYIRTQLLLNSADPLTTQHQIENMHESGLNIFNVYQMRQQEEQIMLLMSVFTYGFIVLITLISMANIFNTISTSIALRKREFAMLKSVGMTHRAFSKMLNYESVFYGVKSLVYGLPLSIMAMYLIYRSLGYTFSYSFTLPWNSILFVMGAVFVIVISAMLYSSSKTKQDNIIDALKQETT